MSGIHVARQGFITKAALPSVARQRGPVAYACSLLINGNGPNNAANPLVPKDITGVYAFQRALTPHQVNVSPYTSGASIYQTGTARQAFYSSPVPITTGEFCIEVWCYPENFSSLRDLLNSRAWTTGNNKGWMIQINTTGKVVLSASQGTWNSFPTIITSTASLTANAWNHVAITRDSSNVLRMFINGTLDSSLTYTQSLDQSNGSFGTVYLVVGNNYGDGQFQTSPFNGYIGDIRIGTGTGSAIYTASFTPPTSSLTATTGTVLCMRSTAYVTDSGSNNIALFPFNSVAQSPLSPFASPYYGSIALTGAVSSYVGATSANTADFAFGTGDFNIEGWVLLRSLTVDSYVYDSRSGSSGAYPTLFVNTLGQLVYHTNNADRIVSGTTLSLNTWYHVAVSRSGASTRLFLNGVQAGSTYSDSANYLNNSSRPVIGVSGFNTALNSLNGNISNLRVVKGSAIYTADFTPSTVPLTAVAGTSMLLLGDNVGVTDVSTNAYNVGVWGNAKISTAQSKFGGSSILLDGSGDYLTVASATPLLFTVSMFHVECWVYRAATGVVHTIACKGASNNGWMLQINASDKLTFTTTTSIVMTSTSSIPANTWTHIAVTRDGSNLLRMFINGTQESSVVSATSFSQTNDLVIGADRSLVNFFNGYIEDFRIFRDGAKYLSAFSAPTSELPVIDDCYRYFTNTVYGVYQLT